jgi:hypothetical protein
MSIFVLSPTIGNILVLGLQKNVVKIPSAKVQQANYPKFCQAFLSQLVSHDKGCEKL